MALIKMNVYVILRPAVGNVTMTVHISSVTKVFFYSAFAQCIIFISLLLFHVCRLFSITNWLQNCQDGSGILRLRNRQEVAMCIQFPCFFSAHKT